MIKSHIDRYSSATRYEVRFVDKPLRYLYAYKGKTGPAYIGGLSANGLPIRDLKRLVSALEELIDKDVFGDPSK
jgi:hypothetical protein